MKKTSKPKPPLVQFRVKVDTREQQPLDFSSFEEVLGVETVGLKTGDYTLEGYEEVFVIERKGSTGEIAQNVLQKRFYDELDRLEAFSHPFILCEFTREQVLAYPFGSGVPAHRWRWLKMTGPFLMKKLVEIELKYRVKFIYAGESARQWALSLFKRVVETCPKTVKT